MEQTMIGFSAGIAKGDYYPIIYDKENIVAIPNILITDDYKKIFENQPLWFIPPN